MEDIKIDYDGHALKWEQSKLSQKRYCQMRDINYGKFVSARIKLQASRGNTRAPAKFIELKQKSPAITNSSSSVMNATSSLSLKFPNGIVLDIPANLEAEQFSKVFSTLKGLL